MKIIVSIEEVKKIVYAHLSKVMPVSEESAEIVSVTEGRYDDQTTEITGISFDLNL